MAPENEAHRAEVYEAIELALSSGKCSSYDDVLYYIGSADPRLVKEVYNEITMPKDKAGETKKYLGEHRDEYEARRKSASLPMRLPAPDPFSSQWWFSLESIVAISEKAHELSKKGPVAFLGAPTVGYHYANRYDSPTTILDRDRDVIASLDLPENAQKLQYNVNDDLEESLQGKHTVVVADPPWYRDITNLFIYRSRELITATGFLLIVLPARLTRAGTINERTLLLQDLITSNFEMVALESKAVLYRVPNFERKALDNLEEFSGREWRRGDLLILKISQNSQITKPSCNPTMLEIYYRNKKERRYFLNKDRADSSLKSHVEPIEGFNDNVSTRNIAFEKLALWSSDKHGVAINNDSHAITILKSWSEGKSITEAATALAENGASDAQDIVDLFEEHLNIWSEEGTTTKRRDDKELNDKRKSYLSGFAEHPSNRKYNHNSDGFRLEFQRDRDRILWSHALKRLSNKTQMFPVKSDDHLRRRLSHSVEVMQLASTIAVSFGLDRDLTEAGALAHDLGHTPFGHAGEHAINNVLNDIDIQFNGFNHYEHGVDVVSWLEDVYQSPGAGGIPGLNLSPEVIECIFKHTYYRGAEPVGQFTLSKKTKHQDLRNDVSCHLEGQAVRIADKLSYLVSDLEDGCRMNLIKYDDLLKCRLFQRPPIDIVPAIDESLYERFVSQRRAILKVLMEDILTATDKRLITISNRNDVRKEYNYLVDFSPEIAVDVKEIWTKLQAGILHKDPTVRSSNERAARIIRDLLIFYCVAPHLVDEKFRSAHAKLEKTDYIKWYIKNVGQTVGLPKRLISAFAYEHAISSSLRPQGDNYIVDIKNIIQAKDFVASLTDTKAIDEHRKNYEFK